MLVGLLAASNHVLAVDTLDFDANGGAGANDGTGNWDTTTTDFFDVTTSAVTNGSSVSNYVFNAAGGADTVTLGANVNGASLTLDALSTGSDTFNAGTSNFTLTIGTAGTTNSVAAFTADADATFNNMVVFANHSGSDAGAGITFGANNVTVNFDGTASSTGTGISTSPITFLAAGATAANQADAQDATLNLTPSGSNTTFYNYTGGGSNAGTGQINIGNTGSIGSTTTAPSGGLVIGNLASVNMASGMSIGYADYSGSTGTGVTGIAAFGSAGLVTVNSGGALTLSSTSTGNLTVGRNQAGRLIINGGSVNITAGSGANSTLFIADTGVNNTNTTATSGEVDVENGGSLSVATSVVMNFVGASGGTSFLSTQGNAVLNISGGTASIGGTSAGGIVFGTTGSGASVGIAKGNSEVTLTGGTLYVGAGGITETTNDQGTYAINLSGGTVGATAAWSSSLNMSLNPGTVGVGAGVSPVTFLTADANTVAHNITLSGVLSGSGGMSVSGLGTLNITGTSNTYSGPTVVGSGTLSLASGGTSSVEVGSAKLVLNLSTSLASTASLTLDTSGASLVDLNYSGIDMISALTINGTSVAANTYTAAQLDTDYGTTDFENGFAGEVEVEAASTPEPSTLALLGAGTLLMFMLGLLERVRRQAA